VWGKGGGTKTEKERGSYSLSDLVGSLKERKKRGGNRREKKGRKERTKER
jgi:hypothetical protein